jgi:D-alanyl-D-alanine carboxypeptidase
MTGHSDKGVLLPALVIGLVLAGGAAAFGFVKLSEANNALAEASKREAENAEKMASLENDNRALSEALDAEQRRNEENEDQLEELAETVGMLDKLAKTDPELLAKYSKVYFLSENYIPKRLSQIPQKYVNDADDEFFISQALPDLRDLMDEAAEDGVDLTVVSGYRSFDTQKALKSGYSVTYGTGANAFSADQGYSEHQLGTAVDFSTKTSSGALDGFQNTPAYAWLLKNAHRFGFILSYPAGNAYYQYEPWHWRFVGRDLAGDLKDNGKNFYDLDQRELDKYLVTIFD